MSASVHADSAQPPSEKQAGENQISLELPESPVVRDLDEVAEEAGAAFRSAEPFPHCCVDGLFSDALLEKVVEEFPSEEAKWTLLERRAGSRRKSVTGPQDELGPYTTYFLSYLGSSKFLSFVEKVTGIPGLMTDPHVMGGGLHEIKSGGFLELHADFNWHNRLRMFRRLNFLLYLNKDWKEEYGGALELWDPKLEKGAKYPPFWNRMVIQAVTADTMHGFPAPLECPEGMSRKSLAMWFYTTELPLDVQLGYDLCDPDFIRRDGEAHPLPRPLWRKFLPPLFLNFLNKHRHTRPFYKRDLGKLFTRFLPPIAMEAWFKARSQKRG
jgi:hypothetical protein